MLASSRRATGRLPSRGYSSRVDRNPFQLLLVAASLEYRAGIPALALDLTRHAGKRALVYGELDADTLSALEREQVGVTTAPTIAEALRTLAWSTFDAVLVVPETPDGLVIAKALKLGALRDEIEEVDEMTLRLAAARHRRRPVFVAPFRGDVEYAVIVAAPDLAYLERADRYPFSRAVAHFNATALFAAGGSEGAGIA